jgi:hypothetical protein
MHLVLVLLLAVLAAGWWIGRKNGEASRTLLAVAGGIATLVALFSLLLGGPAPADGHPDVFAHAVGSVLGEKLAGDFPDGGRVLVIQMPVAWYGGEEAMEKAEATSNAQMQGLQESGGARNFAFVSARLETVAPLDQLRAVALESARGLPPQAYRTWLADVPDAVAIVSFLPLMPTLTPQMLSELPPLYGISFAPADAWAPLLRSAGAAGGVVVDRKDGDWQAPLKVAEGGAPIGGIPAVVLDRQDGDWHAEPGRFMSPQDVFDLRFQLVTPGTIDDAVNAPPVEE